MHAKSKKFIGAFLVGCALALMLTFLRAQLFNGGVFSAADTARFLSDGFLTIGVVFTAIYALHKISATGMTDGVLFVARKCFESITFGKNRTGNYATFKARRESTSRKTHPYLLWSGLAFLGLSGVCCLWFLWI